MWEQLIPAAGNLISSFLGRSAADDQREAENQRFQQNLAYQREFAQSGIQWKVADARAAGIHPMAALGANTVSYTPMALGDIGADLRAKSGQDLGRAVAAVAPKEDRENETIRAANALSLERAGLENELLRSQIARTRQQIGPPAVTPNTEHSVFGGNVPPGHELNRDDWGKNPNPPEHVGLKTPFGVWLTNPETSDSQKWEDRYGDIAEEVAGLGINAPADIWQNIGSARIMQLLARALSGAPLRPQDSYPSHTFRQRWKSTLGRR